MQAVNNETIKLVTHSLCKWQKMQLMGNDNDRSFPLQQTEM